MAVRHYAFVNSFNEKISCYSLCSHGYLLCSYGCSLCSHGHSLCSQDCSLCYHGCSLCSHGCSLCSYGCSLHSHGCSVCSHGCPLRSLGTLQFKLHQLYGSPSLRFVNSFSEKDLMLFVVFPWLFVVFS